MSRIARLTTADNRRVSGSADRIFGPCDCSVDPGRRHGKLGRYEIDRLLRPLNIDSFDYLPDILWESLNRLVDQFRIRLVHRLQFVDPACPVHQPVLCSA